MTLTDELRQAVVDGQPKAAVEKTTQGLAQGVPAVTLLHDGLIAAMRRVGELYDQGEYYVPEMLVAAHAMKESLAVLEPHLVADGVPTTATVAIGTVKGDLHDVGKNLVSMIEGAGYQIVDLGVDVPAEGFVQAVRHGADVVGMSTPPHDDDATHEGEHRRDRAGRPAWRCNRRGRRCADHRGVRARDRRGRIRTGCVGSGPNGRGTVVLDRLPRLGRRLRRTRRRRRRRHRRRTLRPARRRRTRVSAARRGESRLSRRSADRPPAVRST
jgi:hypothetical protein